MPEQMTVEVFLARLKAQGVSNSNHFALVCPMCGTPQSIASLVRAGATPEWAEDMIGFACEGRLTDAGPWPSSSDRSTKARARRRIRGCDWTLGGLFKIHELEVLTPDGKEHPRFRIATPRQARALERDSGAPAQAAAE
ncbi:conserved protein of unknown function (plasmid) [Rhodovastum atsumiense]|uniref:Uncharacterized protein n=1 Tax=Rhodovastum atsumiense TaxID=504468 RepID=A0A5M6IW54_9PROT|nr:VVA0879 family protein [Rhodovastum atsumiense]KAA5611635.1 hypothetical protein F1189_13830 [Rhodovastum atsumiense]CAH2606271.1 conserved protein of unknown function [Rhodovastum atsumiense]